MSSGTPYIGSRISLVSKAEIRYVGTLYSIDTKESTVTLASVQSYGTEDRKDAASKILPREAIWEYIVFRGQDIKDLHVCEPPALPKSAPQQHPQDPAIIQSATASSPGSYTPFRGNPYQTPSGFSPFGGLPYGNYPVGFQQPPGFPDRQMPGVMPPQMPVSMAPGTPILPRIPTPPLPQTIGISRTSTPSPELCLSPAPVVKTEGTQTKAMTQQSTQTAQAKKKPSSRRESVEKTQEKENKKPEQVNKEKENTGEQPEKKQYNEHRSRGNNRRPQGRRGGSRGPRQDAGPKEFEGEYDFESANAKFKKEDIEEEFQKKLRIDLELNDAEVEVEGEQASGATAQSPTPVTYYNKTTSFFDSISCEANDRDKNRKAHPSWQEERKLNTETFGVSGLRRGGGRGSYRGRGGRGPYRGRGGGRGYYRGRGSRGGRGGYGFPRGSPNRDWVDYPLDVDTSKLQRNLPNGPSTGPSVDQAPVQA